MTELSSGRWFLRIATFSLTIPQELCHIVEKCTELIDSRPGLAHKMGLLVPSVAYPDIKLDGFVQKRPMGCSDYYELIPPGQATRMCLRCARTERELSMHELMSSSALGAYERAQQYSCFCGGKWMTHPKAIT